MKIHRLAQTPYCAGHQRSGSPPPPVRSQPKDWLWSCSCHRSVPPRPMTATMKLRFLWQQPLFLQRPSRQPLPPLQREQLGFEASVSAASAVPCASASRDIANSWHGDKSQHCGLRPRTGRRNTGGIWIDNSELVTWCWTSKSAVRVITIREKQRSSNE